MVIFTEKTKEGNFHASGVNPMVISGTEATLVLQEPSRTAVISNNFVNSVKEKINILQIEIDALKYAVICIARTFIELSKNEKLLCHLNLSSTNCLVDVLDMLNEELKTHTKYDKEVKEMQQKMHDIMSDYDELMGSHEYLKDQILELADCSTLDEMKAKVRKICYQFDIRPMASQKVTRTNFIKGGRSFGLSCDKDNLETFSTIRSNRIIKINSGTKTCVPCNIDIKSCICSSKEQTENVQVNERINGATAAISPSGDKCDKSETIEESAEDGGYCVPIKDGRIMVALESGLWSEGLHQTCRTPKNNNDDMDAANEDNKMKKFDVTVNINAVESMYGSPDMNVTVKTETPDITDEANLSIKNELSVFTCLKCGDMYTNEMDLRIHEEFHLEFKYCLCGERFATSQAIKMHKKDVHHGGFLCNLCPNIRAFKHYSTLFQHKKVQHSQGTAYACHVCGKKFGHLGHLTDHQRVHSNIAEFACNNCDKKFKYLRGLKKHTLTCKDSKPIKKEESDIRVECTRIPIA